MPATHKLWRSFSQAANYEEAIKKPQERVLLILRAHPAVNLNWLILGILAFLLPFLFGHYLNFLKLPPGYELFVLVFYYGLIFSYSLTKFYHWYFNIGVVTNRKIVDVDANNLLNTITTATTVAKVEEVEKKSLGVYASIFNYGDIFVQTAGEIPTIEFLNVPNPEEVIKVINLNMKAHGSG